MEAVKQIIKTPKDHEIKIKVPRYVPENETIEVILIYKKKQDTFKQKIQELKKAAKDTLFLAYYQNRAGLSLLRTNYGIEVG